MVEEKKILYSDKWDNGLFKASYYWMKRLMKICKIIFRKNVYAKYRNTIYCIAAFED